MATAPPCNVDPSAMSNEAVTPLISRLTARLAALASANAKRENPDSRPSRPACSMTHNTRCAVASFIIVAHWERFESPMITCSLRKASGSACGSSLVLTIGRDLVVADETASSKKSARCVIWKPDSVTRPAPVNSCLVIRNGSNSCSMTSNGTNRRTR